MLISLSLSKPSNKRRSEPTTKKMSRMGSIAFQKLSRAKKKKYLEIYPNSSHRFLLAGKKKPTTKEAGKKSAKKVAVKTKAAPNKAFTRRISRTAYDKLGKRQQNAYDKLYPDAAKKFIGKKHIAIKRINPILEAKRKKLLNHVPMGSKLEKLKASEDAIVNASRQKAHQDFKSAVTPEAVEACKSLTTDDTKAAATAMRSKKAEVLDSFHAKVEDERLDNTEITDEQADELQTKIDRDEVADPEAVTEILQTRGKKKSKKQKREEQRRVEEELEVDTKKMNFFQRDMHAMGQILRGEKVNPKGKNNFLVAMNILGRYAMVAGGIAAISLGAAPLAIHIVKEIYDNWDTSALGSSDDYENDYHENVSKAYDSITDYLFHLDVDALHASVGKTKFVSTSATEVKSRISYRSFPEEKALPIASRSRWRVMLDGRSVGEIYADEDGEVTQTVRVWKAYVTEGFSPLEFPHVDQVDVKIKEPFILTNDDTAIEHNLELHSPSLMTLPEARSWVCSIIERK